MHNRLERQSPPLTWLQLAAATILTFFLALVWIAVGFVAWIVFQ